jgi:hypothetical protein
MEQACSTLSRPSNWLSEAYNPQLELGPVVARIDSGISGAIYASSSARTAEALIKREFPAGEARPAPSHAVDCIERNGAPSEQRSCQTDANDHAEHVIFEFDVPVALARIGWDSEGAAT